MSSTSIARCFALVPCAGIGERAEQGGPKQYAMLAGASVVAHTLAALAQVRRIERTLVVLSPIDTAFAQAAPTFDGWTTKAGGATRAETVAQGIVELAKRGVSSNDWVLVHDAARCLVRAQWIDALIDACHDDPVGGLLALPVADTLKRSRDARVESTVDRRALWQAQTPQMFRLGMLRDALANIDTGITDEAGAMEAAGHAPRLVQGALENFKLTYPMDFELAQRLLVQRLTLCGT